MRKLFILFLFCLATICKGQPSFQSVIVVTDTVQVLLYMDVIGRYDANNQFTGIRLSYDDDQFELSIFGNLDIEVDDIAMFIESADIGIRPVRTNKKLKIRFDQKDTDAAITQLSDLIWNKYFYLLMPNKKV